MTGTVLMKSLMKKPNLKDEYVSDVVCRIVYYDLYFSFNSIFSSLFIIILINYYCGAFSSLSLVILRVNAGTVLLSLDEHELLYSPFLLFSKFVAPPRFDIIPL